MVDCHFKTYNDGNNLVIVLYNADGSESYLHKRKPLSSIGLKSTGHTPHYELQHGEIKIPNEKTLIRGGLKCIVKYEKERVLLVPLNKYSDEIEEKSVRYTFEHLNVEYSPKTEIQEAKSKSEIIVQRERKPVSDETWP